MTEDDRVRAHVFVSGEVQGVYFRASTREQAQRQNVDGWVRNLDDGRVEAVFEGTPNGVETMLEWCESGSRRADVETVDVEYEEPRDIDGFRVRY